MRAGIGENEMEHVYCDDHAGLAALAKKDLPTIFGPGPNGPKDVPESVELARRLLGRAPILGICLGHQILGALAGAEIVKARNPWHGSVTSIRVLDNSGMFAGLADEIGVVCYNSLVVKKASLPPSWKVVSTNSDDEIMAMEFESTKIPTWSVQFHPESFLSQSGERIVQNWLARVPR